MITSPSSVAARALNASGKSLSGCRITRRSAFEEFGKRPSVGRGPFELERPFFALSDYGGPRRGDADGAHENRYKNVRARHLHPDQRGLGPASRIVLDPI